MHREILNFTMKKKKQGPSVGYYIRFAEGVKLCAWIKHAKKGKIAFRGTPRRNDNTLLKDRMCKTTWHLRKSLMTTDINLQRLL